MEGLQPIKFEPRTYHPTCHWLAGLNHCSSATSNVKCYFYLPPPPLVETHIMKTYKWIAWLLAEWIVAPLQRPCEQRTSSPSPLLPPHRMGRGPGEGPFTVQPGLLLETTFVLTTPITRHQLLITGSPLTNYQSRLTNHLSPIVQISTQLHPGPAKSTKTLCSKIR